MSIGLGVEYHPRDSVDVMSTEMSKILFDLELMKLNNFKSECHLAKYLEGKHIPLAHLVDM